MKLYRVSTVADEFSDCKNVTFRWFRDCGDPEPKRPYAKLIKDYDPYDQAAVYQKAFIEELFTSIEANALKEYLDRVHGRAGTATIEEVDLPARNNRWPYRGIAVGGGDSFYNLHKEPKYSLPFKVTGYFDLVGCELADGSGETFRRYLILIRTGGDGKLVGRRDAARGKATRGGWRMTEQALEARARRVAKRVGLMATKSLWRRDSIDNFGGFILHNWIVAGSRFVLSAENVLEYCAERGGHECS
jgi:hypothetical protein